MFDLLSFEWVRDKVTGMTRKVLSIPKDEKKKERLVAGLTEALERATGQKVTLTKEG